MTVICTCWIVNHWKHRLTSKVQRSFELPKLYTDAGYILALDTESVREPESIQSSLVLFFLFSKQISAIFSAIL